MIAAKPTFYRQRLFRSQLEARWALFFDRLGIRYRYEPKQFRLGYSLFYTPDFWLPDHRCFIEIKGIEPKRREKMQTLAREYRANVYTFFGNVGTPQTCENRGAYVDYGDDYYLSLPANVHLRLAHPAPITPPFFNAYGKWGKSYGWSECLHCGQLTIASTKEAMRWQCTCQRPLDAPHTMTSPRLQAAYRAANAYRFLRPTQTKAS
jgi:hypothetical protein